MNTFENLKISKPLLKILESESCNTPYPIQEKAIPVISKGRDVLGIAKTGSGKTLSYVLPILEKLNGKAPSILSAKDRRAPLVLVVVPTRELAVQVNDVFKLFSVDSDIKSMAVFGGVSINPQMKALNNVSILVATPGRLLKLVETNAITLDKVETLVLDEADKILNEGFSEEVNQILNLLPKKRQNLLFSATLNEGISHINKVLLKNPERIKIESVEGESDLINQEVYVVSDARKGPFLRYLIVSQNMKQVLVFTSSVARANRVAEKLRKNGIDAMAIHKKKTQGVRTDLLTKFKHGKLNVLVSTDLLSRGIDIDLLPYVINYELPRSPKVFIHRIGRTGRAETEGKAITLITPEEEAHFRVIEKKMKKRIPRTETEEVNLHGY